VDSGTEIISEQTKSDPDIELITMSSVDPNVAQRIASVRREYPGPRRHLGWRPLENPRSRRDEVALNGH
jgi:hypothetical protein